MFGKKDLIRLAELGKRYHANGWMPGTAGNLSIRDASDPNSFWVSGSGLDKNQLEPNDFLKIDLKTGTISQTEKNKKGLKPSAETSIHRAVYLADSTAGCVLHVHTPESNLLHFGLSHEDPVTDWTLPSIEIVKAFGIWDENPEVKVPAIYNFPVVQQISDQLQSYLQEHKPRAALCIIEKHGITVWGKDLVQANRHLEAADFLLKVWTLSALGALHKSEN
ncbi:methylthioribulose 1-phosphate dehydratase [Leptospira perolatii]|uniref:Methylthioribulose-1-phosphate dehydratase n=1 Tax=Leptospira perolatii TaxID=2023191 RepID=A0A2M9ZQ09_9LEPT|nr:methylthioribulose 1-phosphate dehydratase [Leptospira perolatii]PJZ70805.1 methylthioribulose 1-phosphate dehydratase [Leptospira perolatii]PJZ74013.1 methylthioribulose 1-phosphate dehydratase [Leptospira perolatii]